MASSPKGSVEDMDVLYSHLRSKLDPSADKDMRCSADWRKIKDDDDYRLAREKALRDDVEYRLAREKALREHFEMKTKQEHALRCQSELQVQSKTQRIQELEAVIRSMYSNQPVTTVGQEHTVQG